MVVVLPLLSSPTTSTLTCSSPGKHNGSTWPVHVSNGLAGKNPRMGQSVGGQGTFWPVRPRKSSSACKNPIPVVSSSTALEFEKGATPEMPSVVQTVGAGAHTVPGPGAAKSAQEYHMAI
jgi:hypothetical protein